MKSTPCSLPRPLAKATLLIILCLLSFAPASHACGPSYDYIPVPDFFFSSANNTTLADTRRSENLRLWQQQTSPSIPLADIEELIYDSKLHNVCHFDLNENKMWNFISHTNDLEAAAMIVTLKRFENALEKLSSPWHYPESRYGDDSDPQIEKLISFCNNYSKPRFKDRYALQAVRALHKLRLYDDCINYADTAFARFPDSNLFKQMARGYAAGSWYHLGDTLRAIEIFTEIGDYESALYCGAGDSFIISNPNAPGIMAAIQKNATDSLAMAHYDQISARVISGGKALYPGDWYFLRAFVALDFREDAAAANQFISQALRLPFSSEDFRDHARAYSVKINAALGRTDNLLSDIRWFESKIALTSSDAMEWRRMLHNILLIDAVPSLWRRGDYTTAILLAAYVDRNHDYDHFTFSECFYPTNHRLNHADYSGLNFRLMQSLTSSQMIDFCRQMRRSTPLYDHLRPTLRSDDDYLNDIIGTLALREENYSRAKDYLAQVSTAYEATMNVYPYLRRNPFLHYPVSEENRYLPSAERAKYNFAVRMLDCQSTINSPSADPDLRARALLDYAMGRRNALTDCWALTRYWNAEYLSNFAYPYTDINRYDKRIDYSFLEEPICFHDYTFHSYDYEFDEYALADDNYVKINNIELRYASEIIAALRSFQSPEAKAEALYRLNALPAIITHYPSTPTAALIRSSCDSWRSWL